jgi:adenylate kinase
MKLFFSLIFTFLFSLSVFASAQKQTVVILLGAPASGKGTQAKFIQQQLKIPQISTGDLFRENLKNNTSLGLEAKKYMNEGKLVPDNLVVDMLLDRVKKEDAKDGYLLDGFPRTISQAKAYDDFVQSKANIVVILIDVPQDVLLQRIAERQKIEGRADDTQEIASERLKVYNEQTLPLIAYYKDKGNFYEINGDRAVKEVQKDIKKILESNK